MKVHKIVSGFAVLSFGLLLSLGANAGGNGVGNGGDGYASEFVLTARTAIKLMKKAPPESLGKVNLDLFTGAVLNAQVLSEDQLTLNGNEVDAINYPDRKLIKISRSRWNDLRSATRTAARFNLVIHEYLGIMRVDDSQYRISQPLIRAISPSNFSTSTWWNPMNPTNEVTFSMSSGGMSCSSGQWTLQFNVNTAEETFSNEMTCGESVRKAVVVKKQRYGAGGDLMGTFHTFEVSVFDEKGEQLGRVDYAPEWGRCLVPTENYCSQSGEFKFDNVEFHFGLALY